MFYQGLQNQAGNLFLLISFPLYVHVRASPFHKSRTKLALIPFGELCTYVHRYVLDLYFVPHKSSPFSHLRWCTYVQPFPEGDGKQIFDLCGPICEKWTSCNCFGSRFVRDLVARTCAPKVLYLLRQVRAREGDACTCARVMHVRATLLSPSSPKGTCCAYAHPEGETNRKFVRNEGAR